jgi:hypothetical protein
MTENYEEAEAVVSPNALEQPVHEPVKTVTTVVVRLSTCDIVVTTFLDGSFTVESKSVTCIKVEY